MAEHRKRFDNQRHGTEEMSGCFKRIVLLVKFAWYEIEQQWVQNFPTQYPAL